MGRQGFGAFNSLKLGFLPNFPVSEHYATFHHPAWGMRLDLHPCQPGERQLDGGPWIYLNVEEIQTVVADLAASGIDCDPIQDIPHIPRHSAFRDLEGNVWGLEGNTSSAASGKR